jgi:type II secretory pathway pseudopilin PulG
MTHQLKRLSPPSTQSGFTIIESLLAILIVTALLVAIAPVIALSVATRVQARRVEQATQAARTYIDGVRSGKITAPARVKLLDEVVDLPNGNRFVPKRDGATGFAELNAPPRLSIPNCRATADPIDPKFPHYCRNAPDLSLYCIDFDGDNICQNSSNKDLIVQAFRSGTDSADDGSKGYLLAVRVYRAAAFNGSTVFQTTQERLREGGKKVATNTAGTGDYRAPLVELTTEVRGTNNEKAYDGFCDRLGGCQQ